MSSPVYAPTFGSEVCVPSRRARVTPIRRSRCWTSRFSSCASSAPASNSSPPACAGPKGRCGSATGVICCSPTSRTTASCAGTRPPGAPASFARRRTTPTATRATARGGCSACEHLTRRVTRTEYDGSITVLADRLQGKRLNSPNDIVCARDGGIWFTDPLFGILGHWEGEPAEQRNAAGGVPHRPGSGELQRVIDDLAGAQRPRVLARRERCSTSSRAAPCRIARSGHTTSAPTARSRTSGCSSTPEGRAPTTASRSTSAGNVWCGFGSRQPAPTSTQLDGVRVYTADGRDDRPHPPARALRQPVFRRRQEQPPVHGREPLAVRAVRQHHRRGVSPGGGPAARSRIDSNRSSRKI